MRDPDKSVLSYLEREDWLCFLSCGVIELLRYRRAKFLDTQHQLFLALEVHLPLIGAGDKGRQLAASGTFLACSHTDAQSERKDSELKVCPFELHQPVKAFALSILVCHIDFVTNRLGLALEPSRSMLRRQPYRRECTSECLTLT